MPPRLAHKKSRNGCQRCKARRVKCDERHPVCGHCARHQVPCTYGSPSRSPSASVAQVDRPKTAYSVEPPSLPTESATPSTVAGGQQQQQRSSSIHWYGPTSPYEEELDGPDLAFDPDQRRLLELRLLHWFTTAVVPTFPSSEVQSRRDVWVIDGVQIALEHPFLLNAIFAISALHLAYGSHGHDRYSHYGQERISVARIINQPPGTLVHVDFQRAHRVYLNLAIRQQREAVANLSAKNANAIFLCTILLQYQVLRCLPDKAGREIYEPPVQWLKMSRAVTAVGYIARPLVKHSSVIELMTHIQQEPNLKDCGSIFGSQNYLGNPVLEPLLDWERFPEPDFSPETRTAYERLLGYIGGVQGAILRRENPRIIFRRLLLMGPYCPKLLHEFLAERRPRALVMIAYHFAMAKEVEDHWIVRDAAEREVNGVRSMLPPEWQWALQWPMRVLQVGVQQATKEFELRARPHDLSE